MVITGASAGVGRATARAAADRGHAVGLIARGSEGLEAARREAESLGARAVAVPADIAEPAAVEAAAEEIERRLGPIDVWVNNAMLSVFSPVHELQEHEVHRVTDVTYHGAVYGTLAALRRMLPRDRGTIVQVGSALAHRAIPLQAAYCGAKHALRGFTDSLRTELLHEGSSVRVAMVHLPALNTPQFGWVRSRLPGCPQPVPPIFQPEVAAQAILLAADRPRRERWIGGPTIKTIIAGRLAPGLVDRYLARTGYEAQQTDEPLPPGRRDNLDGPVPGDAGARGSFSDRSRERSRSFWLRENLAPIALAGAAVAGALGAVGARRR